MKRIERMNKKKKNILMGLGLTTVLFGTVATATVTIANNKLDTNSIINKIDDKNSDDKKNKNIEEKTTAINESNNVDKGNIIKTDNKDNSSNISANNDTTKSLANTSGEVNDQKENSEIKKVENTETSLEKGNDASSTQENIVVAPTNGSI